MTSSQSSRGFGISSLITALRAVRRTLSLRFFRERIIRHQFLNEPLQIVIADPTAKQWYEEQLPTASELHFLRDYALKTGAKVFNIGAHQAVIASMLARVVGRTGSVLALEPEPFSYGIALRNKAINQLDQLEILHAAGTDSTTMIEFGLGIGSSGAISTGQDALQTILVQAYTIDDLAARYGVPDVLYIDVEGFEQQVLSGAQHTLETARPDCVVEVHIGVGLEKAGGSVAGILAFFSPDIYDFYIKHPDANRRDELVPLAEVGGTELDVPLQYDRRQEACHR